MAGMRGVSFNLHVPCLGSALAPPFARPHLWLIGSSSKNYMGLLNWRTSVAVRCCAAPIKVRTEEWTVEEIIDNMSLALGLHHFPPAAHFTVPGRQIWCGMEGDCELKWCMDGRFYEHFICTEMELEQGYDGLSPWAADGAGWVSDLELDDEEAMLLVAWVRSGYWLTEGGRRNLFIQRAYGESDAVHLSIQLKRGKVVGRVCVDPRTWLISRIESRAFGGLDKWEFSGWHSSVPGRCLALAEKITRHSPSGGVQFTYPAIEKSRCDSQDFSLCCPYDHPTSPTLPRHTKYYSKHNFDRTSVPSVKLMAGKNGHYLVCPLINGQNSGYFLLDTGASSLVISKQRANELCMDAFGETFGIGVEGKFKTRFRRGKCFQLGPLRINFPIFMEAPSDMVVKGVFECLSGVCGYEVFHHCVVEVCRLRSMLSLYDPLIYRPTCMEVKWEKLLMLGNVPHAYAKLGGQNALLMLDTGACGADILLHSRAVRELNLLQSFKLRGSSEVGGIGSGNGIKVQYGVYPEVELAGQNFHEVTALFFGDDQPAIDISVYTAGILGGDLILKHLAIFDYPRGRFALVKMC